MRKDTTHEIEEKRKRENQRQIQMYRAMIQTQARKNCAPAYGISVNDIAVHIIGASGLSATREKIVKDGLGGERKKVG